MGVLGWGFVVETLFLSLLSYFNEIFQVSSRWKSVEIRKSSRLVCRWVPSYRDPCRQVVCEDLFFFFVFSFFYFPSSPSSFAAYLWSFLQSSVFLIFLFPLFTSRLLHVSFDFERHCLQDSTADSGRVERVSKHVICMRVGCIRNLRKCLSLPLAQGEWDRRKVDEVLDGDEERREREWESVLRRRTKESIDTMKSKIKLSNDKGLVWRGKYCEESKWGFWFDPKKKARKRDSAG